MGQDGRPMGFMMNVLAAAVVVGAVSKDTFDPYREAKMANDAAVRAKNRLLSRLLRFFLKGGDTRAEQIRINDALLQLRKRPEDVLPFRSALRAYKSMRSGGFNEQAKLQFLENIAEVGLVPSAGEKINPEVSLADRVDSIVLEASQIFRGGGLRPENFPAKFFHSLVDAHNQAHPSASGEAFIQASNRLLGLWACIKINANIDRKTGYHLDQKGYWGNETYAIGDKIANIREKLVLAGLDFVKDKDLSLKDPNTGCADNSVRSALTAIGNAIPTSNALFALTQEPTVEAKSLAGKIIDKVYEESDENKRLELLHKVFVSPGHWPPELYNNLVNSGNIDVENIDQMKHVLAQFLTVSEFADIQAKEVAPALKDSWNRALDSVSDKIGETPVFFVAENNDVAPDSVQDIISSAREALNYASDAAILEVSFDQGLSSGWFRALEIHEIEPEIFFRLGSDQPCLSTVSEVCRITKIFRQLEERLGDSEGALGRGHLVLGAGEFLQPSAALN